MRTLYLCEQGSKVGLEGERLIVESDGVTVSEVHLFKIDSIAVFGNISISTPALGAILANSIITSLFTVYGRLKGTVVPPKSKNIEIRLRQFELVRDPNESLRRASAVVDAKLSNQISVLRRYAYNHPEVDFAAVISDIERLCKRLSAVGNLSSLMGIEGAATRAYFQGFSRMFRQEIDFTGRRKHPAVDPANALLSLGYVLLTREIAGYLETAGLDPYLGFYHQVRYGRQSLALDLVEPFRQPVIDRFVLYLANKKMVAPDDFEETEEGLRLTDTKLRRFLKEYEQWLARSFSADKKHSVREVVQKQVHSFCNSLRENTTYEPFLFK